MNRGNSESSPKPSPLSQDSPFAMNADAAGGGAPVSPFSWGNRDQWPFQDLEPLDEFGFEAPTSAAPAAPVSTAFASPFAVAADRASGLTAPAKISPWQDETLPKIPEAAADRLPVVAAESVRQPQPQPLPVQPQAQPQAGLSPRETTHDFSASSGTIRQLELRAIFGMDRELTAAEILERCRALPRLRHLARIQPEDVVTIEAMNRLMENLGFGSGNLRLQIGDAPLEFIREGQVILAVQNDGGFAPGVRETLIIAARELARMP